MRLIAILFSVLLVFSFMATGCKQKPAEETTAPAVTEPAAPAVENAPAPAAPAEKK
jgi:hypothetical protein